jgi:hypothetical protein
MLSYLKIVLRFSRTLLLIGVATLGAAVCLAAAVCSKCGYELADNLTTCAHCQHPVTPAAAPVAVPASAPTPSSEKADERVAPIVSADVTQAKAHYHAGRVAMARLYCLNALAVNYLTPPGEARNERAAQIRTYIDACAPQPMSLTRPCPVCQGRGRVASSGGGLRGSGSTGFGSRACSSCGGNGKVTVRETVEEVMLRMGAASRQFKSAQQSELRVRIGQVWVPQQIALTLNSRQQVELKRAWAPGCPKCGELGRVICRDCEGGGTVECAAKGCEGGSIKRRTSGGLDGERSVRMVRCAGCSGSGQALCSRCNGSGSGLCKQCHGTGEAPSCRSCAGEGMAVCRRCKGSGQYRGITCTSCQGEGEEVCGSCNGFGRRQ